MTDEGKKVRKYIAKTSFSLFVVNGFEKTTYSAIAKASGLNRSLIQYYYPKKEILVHKFLEAMIAEIDQCAKGLCSSKDNMVRIIIFYQIYYSFLYKNEAAKNLTEELLAHRFEVSSLMGRYFVSQMNVDEERFDECLEAFIFSIGGVHELMYYLLLSQKEVDPVHLCAKTIQVLRIHVFAGQEEQLNEMLQRSILSDKQINTAIEHLCGTLFFPRIIHSETFEQ